MKHAVCALLGLLSLPAFAEGPASLDAYFAAGQQASEKGDYRAASEEFEKMLAIDPSLGRVRLDLGLAYARQQRFAEAKHEFETVRNDPATPDSVKPNIDGALRQIAEATKTNVFSGGVSAGLLYDTNGNSAPGSNNVLVNDTLFTLDARSRAQSDAQLFATATLGHTYRFSDLATEWRSLGTYYQTEQDELDNLDLKIASIQTGPAYNFAGGKTSATLLGGFTNVTLGEHTYLKLYSVEAGLQHRFTNRLSGEANLREEYRDFVNAPGVTVYDDRQGPAHQLRVGGFYSVTPSDILDLFVTYRIEDAREDFYSNRQITPELGYTHLFDCGVFSRGLLTYRDSDYERPDPFVSTQGRHDKERSAGLTIGRTFDNNVSVTTTYEYRNVDSTLTNYDYGNHRITSSLGWKF